MRCILLVFLGFLCSCQSSPSSQTTLNEAPVFTSSLLVDLDRQPDETIKLWPDFPPGGVPNGLNDHFVKRENRYNLIDRAHHEVTRPTLSIFKPEAPDGSAILIVPGGGYKWVVVEKEGYESARWFSRCGATIYVLSYRLPHQGWLAGSDAPLQDAQRAIRLIRSRSALDQIETDRIMVMGFSAGGHLSGLLATRFDQNTYTAIDLVDELPSRPDAVVLMYPVITLTPPFTHTSTSANMVGPNASLKMQREKSVETAPPQDMPPIFLLHASDDRAVPVENSLMAYSAFSEAGAIVSLHLFDQGGHGFGMRGIDNDPLHKWPDLVMDWGRLHGIFGDDLPG